MFRTVSGRLSPWESVLPPELLRLPEELARVDALLDDPAFFAPFAPHFHPVLGRPSIPIECYLRLMFLKFRYRLGYESLCAEVSDSISWRRFCRIPLDAKVPHPTTLMKLTTRCGEGAVAGLNEALWAKAVQARLLRTGRLRADTTVIPANVAYPTDSGLLARAVGKLALVHGSAAGAGRRWAAPPGRGDQRRAAGRRQAREMAATMRARAQLGREESSAAIGRATGDLADLAESVAAQAAAVLRNGRRALPRTLTGRMRGRLAGLDDWRSPSRARRRGPGPPAGRRRPPRDPAGQPARPRRAADPQGPHRPPRPGSGTRPRSPTTTTASCWITASNTAPPPTARNWRPPSNASAAAPGRCPARSPPTAATASQPSNVTCTPRACTPWRSPARPPPHPPARPSSTAAASGPSSNGEPAAKAGSATSSAGTAGTAPAWTAATELPSGAGTGSSATTWPRSLPWPADLPRPNRQFCPATKTDPDLITTTFFRAK